MLESPYKTNYSIKKLKSKLRYLSSYPTFNNKHKQ